MISLTTLQFPPAPWSWMLTIGFSSPISTHARMTRFIFCSISASPRWPADLRDEHPGFRRFFLHVPGLDLPDPAREHDRFDPFPAFPIGQPQTERAGESLDDGLA